ncbi:helix-turn-helix transcriptional regulator [Shewanella denitrificans]|uniref:helix-turn-helix transcriptional regulator n=1 Tax=Shewanella denitrificans TaxID=192073 RepID=UPI000A021D30|nr:helix-turn-helix transcriptional regulator [Shewanella denitrificans]
MKINAELVLKLRNQNSWTQEELAIAAGLNLKTIQRIEKKASASLQSKKALAAVFNIDFQDLDYEELQMKPCSECKSNRVYQYKKHMEFGGFGGELLPGLAPSMFSLAKFLPVVCFDCGHIRFFASKEARDKLEASDNWEEI